jgi:hypothetical protein
LTTFAIGALVLLVGGLIAGLQLGAGNRMPLVGPSVACLLAFSTGVAHVLARWVLRVDPLRDAGYIPLPWPWASVLGFLAIVLPVASVIVLGGFGGLLAWDFVACRPSRWVRAVLYVAVLAFLTIDGLWIFGVAAD